ncbi:PTS system arbutin-like IIC component [Breznakia sp. PF5-3]|uniref:PTS transporter subunit EIIC n=1 Tax=unclassified Breznakia TaxID=2623764 RepID=UPI0024059B6E|nr:MULTISPECIES: PTS transporter subunit EIIC [unclassified Breznakia]MDF9825223.1 PTS system arbutin-like IIC component [Breznakia sp. PM6-1]MDF9836104.1 PTS system arbutin-like IIC component [Breznakia sp. PF5-3]MDF9838744.1 PTS system arbutin-like IIC component [Breznakia sp. PFB2-8]MDF9860768.1 PTS system arbutin-like IIC component [Breznakia sp. PH5-24]
MKEKFLELMNKFSRAMTQPVMYLAVMGTAIALATILQLDFMPEPIAFVGSLIKSMMDAMLNNLSFVFCVGLSVTLAKTKKVDAALISIIIYLMFLSVNNTWLTSQGMLAEPGTMGLFGTGQGIVLGFQVTDMGVFLGMILGCINAYVFNRFGNREFSDMFRIYGGSRFAFIIMIPVILILAIVISYVWPYVNDAITVTTQFMKDAGPLGVFAYAFGNRFLIPTGLHHMLWMPFAFTGFGGTAEIAGNIYQGAANIFYAEMANPSAVTVIDESIRFATFGFAKAFGVIGIALAFIRTAKPENRKTTISMLLPSVFVAAVAGITEPFDFMFIFISPFLWFVHSLLTGLFEMLLWILGSRTFMIYGLLDMFISNLPLDPSITKIYIFLIVGVIAIFVWYFIFTFLIKRFDIKTPGRELITENGVISDASKTPTSWDKDIDIIVEGIGGAENIKSIENCFTRLRIETNDISIIDEEKIKQSNCKGVVLKGNVVQVIIGMNVQDVSDEMKRKLGKEV